MTASMAASTTPPTDRAASTDDPYRECRLCPRECGTDRARGRAGACGASAEVLVARAALHFWEEPPISGERGSGTVFFAGCPLRCSYCQNIAISQGAMGKGMAVDEIASVFLDLQGQRALNLNLVTPTHFAPSIRQAIELARGRGLRLPVIWNTGGYEQPAQVRANRGLVDAYLADVKYADTGLAQALSGVPDYPERASAALESMVEEVGPPRFDEVDGQERLVAGVVVRHLLLPGHLDDSKRVVEMVHRRWGADVRLSLMSQYTPVIARLAQEGSLAAEVALRHCPELGRKVDPRDYEELLDLADSLGVEDYFYQEGDAAEESFIPSFC